MIYAIECRELGMEPWHRGSRRYSSRDFAEWKINELAPVVKDLTGIKFEYRVVEEPGDILKRQPANYP